MKKFTVLLAVMATLVGNSAFAQNDMYTGRGANSAKSTATNNDFQWVIGLGGLAILGVVVGLTAASAASTAPTYSH